MKGQTLKVIKCSFFKIVVDVVAQQKMFWSVLFVRWRRFWCCNATDAMILWKGRKQKFRLNSGDNTKSKPLRNPTTRLQPIPEIIFDSVCVYSRCNRLRSRQNSYGYSSSIVTCFAENISQTVQKLFLKQVAGNKCPAPRRFFEAIRGPPKL